VIAPTVACHVRVATTSRELEVELEEGLEEGLEEVLEEELEEALIGILFELKSKNLRRERSGDVRARKDVQVGV
jgi:predicted house-cleaning noncanonical NTP pyrophosphatase (MazG superfamily)